MNVALLTAAGSGTRMHQDIPKQFIHVDNKPVIIYTMQAFQNHPSIDAILVVTLESWSEVLWAYAKQFNITKLKHIISGGETGQESIRNGLLELEKYYSEEDIVLIHDAIRPMVSEQIITNCIEVTKDKGNSITVIPCAEAMLCTKDGVLSEEIYPRNELKRTQTPQGFHLGELCSVHREAISRGISNSVASCTLMIEMGKTVYFSPGSEKNLKLTTVEDIDIFKALLNEKRSEWLK